MEGLSWTLQAEGDRHERRMWPLVSSRFPTYEVFWRAFIVPMSNRTNPSLTRDDARWFRIRAGVPPRFESLAMAHYSVFYWTGRAVERVRLTNENYPEDVLFLFDSALDCLDIFVAALREVAKDCGIKLKSLPSGKVSKSAVAFETVRAYRNTILHNPVLGRGIDLDGTFILKEERLEKAKSSWAHAASLPADNFVRVSVLLARVTDEFLDALEQIWRKLTAELLSSPSFTRKLLHVTGSSQVESSGSERSAPSALTPLSASGTFFFQTVDRDPLS